MLAAAARRCRRLSPAAVVLRSETARSAASSRPRPPCGGRGSAPGWCRRESRSARRRRTGSVSICTDATCAMWIDCSRPADPARRVVHDARRRDRHLRRKQAVAAAQPAGPEHVPPGERRPLRHRTSTPARTTPRRATAIPARDRRTSAVHRWQADCAGQRAVARAGRRRCQGLHRRAKLMSLVTTGDSPCPTARPARPGTRPEQLPVRQADPLLPAARQRRDPPADRRRLPGVQRRPAVRGLPHLRRQDAGARERHDHRPDRRRRADAGRARRLRHRADGARAGRLHHQHRREPLSRPALRAELHAAPRLAVPRRRRAVRGGRHPHLRRAVPGDGAARDRRLHPRLPRPLRARTGRSSTSEFHYRARPRSARAASRAARSTRWSRAPRSPACRSTPRRPATARSA